MKFLALTIVLGVAGFVVTGCSSGSPADVGANVVTAVSFDSSKYILNEEPDGAVGVIAARESAQNGEPIVVVGRIGGATNPWVEGRAAFVLLDASMLIVSNGTDSTSREICMDDCCATERIGCTTLVKIVDQNGRILPADARQLFGVAADDMVVVRGIASRDEHGNFLVLGDGVHVRR
jgi:hypothetical protein